MRSISYFLACILASVTFSLDIHYLKKKVDDNLIVITPDDPQYTADVANQVGIWNDETPSAIIYALNEADVQAAFSLIESTGSDFRVRSGGSSFGGYSTCSGDCMILDVSSINHTSVDGSLNNITITMGPGNVLTDVRQRLMLQDEYLIPFGVCSLVNIGGYATGGGNGYMHRTLGLLTDNMIAARIITADGTIRVLNEQNTDTVDLFHAIKGGSGGQFGVITEYTFQTVPMPKFTVGLMVYAYNQKNYIQFFQTVRDWFAQNGDTMPDEFNLFTSCAYLPQYTGGFALILQAVYLSNNIVDRAHGETYVRQFFSDISAGITASHVHKLVIPGNFNLFNRIIYGDDGVFLFASGWIQPSRFIFDYNSLNDNFLNETNSFFQGLNNTYRPGNITTNVFLTLELQGGQILKKDPNATHSSYPNRNCVMNVIFGISSVKPENPLDDRDEMESYGSQINDNFLSLLGSTQVYINYQNQYQLSIKDNYFGSGYNNQNDQIFSRLQQVKQKYDPNNFFNYPLSIPLPSSS